MTQSHSPLTNVAGDTPATVFDIYPTDGSEPIKLLGWLRTYADFPISSQRPLPRGDFEQRHEQYTDVLQEIYEVQGTGEWVAVETLSQRNVASYPACQRRVLILKDKQKLDGFFYPSSYLRPLLAAVGVDYVTQLGCKE